jgi:hypothetical protein
MSLAGISKDRNSTGKDILCVLWNIQIGKGIPHD